MLLRLLVSIQFQVLFHSPFGVLFTFPSRYSFTIGQSVVLSLGEWSPLLQTEFLVFRPTQEYNIAFKYGTVTLFGHASLRVPLIVYYIHRLVRFRSPLLSESRLISFPAGT